jgi:phosphatidylinositol alpha-1,6-mannosyltransferase
VARILMVSKPIVPPWNDGSKNLVRTLASHLSRHDATLLTRRGVDSQLRGRAHAEALYGSAGSFAPALRDNAAVMLRLLRGEAHDLWHFFFAPNPRSSTAGRFAARGRHPTTVQNVFRAPHPTAQLRSLFFSQPTVVS